MILRDDLSNRNPCMPREAASSTPESRPPRDTARNDAHTYHRGRGVEWGTRHWGRRESVLGIPRGGDGGSCSQGVDEGFDVLVNETPDRRRRRSRKGGACQDGSRQNGVTRERREERRILSTRPGQSVVNTNNKTVNHTVGTAPKKMYPYTLTHTFSNCLGAVLTLCIQQSKGQKNASLYCSRVWWMTDGICSIAVSPADKRLMVESCISRGKPLRAHSPAHLLVLLFPFHSGCSVRLWERLVF